jgi:TRAP-type C4-dicarboxylate transport system permease small subunit
VIQTFINRICQVFNFLMVIAMGLMVLMVFGNVVLRYGFNSGITMSEELSRWLFVWMTFLGAVVALNRRAHLGTDALIGRLPRLGQKICFVIAQLLMLAMCGLMFKGAWQQTEINLQTTSAVMEASMAWLYGSGMVFAALAALIIFNTLLKFIRGDLSDAELIGFSESEEAPAEQTPSQESRP